MVNDQTDTYHQSMGHDRMVTFRERVIRRLMTRNNVSESELALAVGISRTTLRSKLAGDRLSVPELDRIAHALGAKASTILAEAETCAEQMAS